MCLVIFLHQLVAFIITTLGMPRKCSYVIPKSRTNYSKFSIGFQGAKVWNSIDESLKRTSFRVFKKINMMLNIVRDYTG